MSTYSREPSTIYGIHHRSFETRKQGEGAYARTYMYGTGKLATYQAWLDVPGSDVRVDEAGIHREPKPRLLTVHRSDVEGLEGTHMEETLQTGDFRFVPPG